ncbi:MAG: ATP-binding protein [Roseburia sp.]|nr:ATP-binding protein [Roseburia sp.]
MLDNEDYLNIFHEIKNSITLISGSLQLVAKKHPEVCLFDYWNEAMSEIDFLKNIVTQLSSTRLYGSPKVMKLDIHTLMNQIEKSIRAFSWKDFNYCLSIEENLPLVELDIQLMKQAIVNIIKNAYEATDKPDTIELRVFSKRGRLHITITDHGGGLDPAVAASIFQPFITSKTGGSGLGLVITQQIIESHQGSIQCDSRPGDGCTFTITLPFSQNQ